MDNNELLELFNDPDIIFEMMDEDQEMQSLNENRVAIGPKDKMSLHATIDKNYNLGEGEGYFKWVDHKDYGRADQIARIKFGSPEYVFHNGRDGKQTHELNSKEKKELVETLNKEVNQKMLKDVKTDNMKDKLIDGTIWDLLLYTYNSQLDISDEDMMKYSLKNKNTENMPRNMIPLDIPKPDYTKL